MTQFIIKDARGKQIQSLNKIASYKQTAANMLSFTNVTPYSVWRLSTITGMQIYDGVRTQRLSDAVVAILKERSL